MYPKNPFACPKTSGIGPPTFLYSFRMGLEAETSYSRNGPGFLGVYMYIYIYILSLYIYLHLAITRACSVLDMMIYQISLEILLCHTQPANSHRYGVFANLRIAVEVFAAQGGVACVTPRCKMTHGNLPMSKARICRKWGCLFTDVTIGFINCSSLTLYREYGEGRFGKTRRNRSTFERRRFEFSTLLIIFVCEGCAFWNC